MCHSEIIFSPGPNCPKLLPNADFVPIFLGCNEANDPVMYIPLSNILKVQLKGIVPLKEYIKRAKDREAMTVNVSQPSLIVVSRSLLFLKKCECVINTFTGGGESSTPSAEHAETEQDCQLVTGLKQLLIPIKPWRTHKHAST